MKVRSTDAWSYHVACGFSVVVLFSMFLWKNSTSDKTLKNVDTAVQYGS